MPVEEGMVVLDALHWIQAHAAPDLAVRWNCKAAKCGSCSAEVNGRPSLTCKTRLSDFDPGEPITVEPMRAFPLIRDLVTDVSWNYEVNKTIPPFSRHRRTCPRRTGAGSRRTSSGSRSSGSASSASSARTSATSCATTRPSSRSWARASSSAPPASRCTRSTRPTGRGYLKDDGGHRLLQHHEVLHRGLPGAHQDHRQRDHPAQGARRGQVLRPDPDGLAQAPREGASRSSGRRPALPAAGPASGARERPTGGDRPDARAAPADRGPDRGFVVRTDGAARGNPGPASAGAVLIDLDRPDARDPRAAPDATISEFLGVQTNNVAEYTAVVRALALAAELGAREVAMLLDSKLIVEQLAGRWRVKDAKLIPLWEACPADPPRRSTAGRRDHVPRAQNSLADALCNEAIDRVAAGGPAIVVRRPDGSAEPEPRASPSSRPCGIRAPVGLPSSSSLLVGACARGLRRHSPAARGRRPPTFVGTAWRVVASAASRRSPGSEPTITFARRPGAREPVAATSTAGPTATTRRPARSSSASLAMTAMACVEQPPDGRRGRVLRGAEPGQLGSTSTRTAGSS